jgi:hypothetical protein
MAETTAGATVSDGRTEAAAAAFAAALPERPLGLSELDPGAR